MSISEKLTDIKFTKSAIGYSAKEVDAFVGDLLPLAKEQEQLILALKVKLEAFDAQRGEIEGKEKQALRLLEAAKKEAEIIVATAKKNAADKERETELSCEVQLRAATARAAEIIAEAEKKAKTTASDAEANADRIIRTADGEARAIIEKVKAYSKEETRKAQQLSNECAAFEASFKELVAKTAKELAAIKENTPLPASEKAVSKREEPSAEKEEPKAEPESIIVPEPPKEEASVDVSPSEVRERVQKKHLYDAVPVTYDDENEQDFTDIRDIMKRVEKCKSPTHFSE